jgi:hypothetical protein
MRLWNHLPHDLGFVVIVLPFLTKEASFDTSLQIRPLPSRNVQSVQQQDDA